MGKLIIRHYRIHYLLLIILFLFHNILLWSQSVVINSKVWDGIPYAAFTSLSFYEGYFYCAFRVAKKHVDYFGKDNGRICIIRSKSGYRWSFYQTICKEGHDLRDPQLCISPSNQLLLTAEDVVYMNGKPSYRKTIVSKKNKRGNFSSINDILYNPSLTWDWLWQPSTIDRKICGFIYCPYFAFVTSEDGSTFNVGKALNVPDTPTEASVASYNNNLVTVVRTSNQAIIGFSKNGLHWNWSKLNIDISCPKLIVYKEVLFCIGRIARNNKNILCLLKIDPIKNVADIILELCEGYDNSYPGAVILNNILYISYYHGDGERSNIYIAILKLD